MVGVALVRVSDPCDVLKENVSGTRIVLVVLASLTGFSLNESLTKESLINLAFSMKGAILSIV